MRDYDRMVATGHQDNVPIFDSHRLINVARVGIDALENKALRRVNTMIVGHFEQTLGRNIIHIVFVRRIARGVSAWGPDLHNKEDRNRSQSSWQKDWLASSPSPRRRPCPTKYCGEPVSRPGLADTWSLHPSQTQGHVRSLPLRGRRCGWHRRLPGVCEFDAFACAVCAPLQPAFTSQARVPYCFIFAASSSAYLLGCQTRDGPPKQGENVADGSVTPTSVPATFAV